LPVWLYLKKARSVPPAFPRSMVNRGKQWALPITPNPNLQFSADSPTLSKPDLPLFGFQSHFQLSASFLICPDLNFLCSPLGKYLDLNALHWLLWAQLAGWALACVAIASHPLHPTASSTEHGLCALGGLALPSCQPLTLGFSFKSAWNRHFLLLASFWLPAHSQSYFSRDPTVATTCCLRIDLSSAVSKVAWSITKRIFVDSESNSSILKVFVSYWSTTRMQKNT
jgi:hypothetical protein